MRREWFLIFLSPLVLVALAGGIIISRHRATTVRTGATPGVELYEEVMGLATERYVVEPDQMKLAWGAAKGMVEHGLDEHCRVYDEVEWERQKSRSRGTYAGIGVRVGRLEGWHTVLWVDPRGPAFDAQLRAGDRILAIDGQKVRQEELAQVALAGLSGPVSEEVALRVRGRLDSQERTVRVPRATVEEQNVFGRMLDHEHGVAYVCITGFQKNVLEHFRAVMTVLRKKGMTSVVLDLRGNRGGDLRAATDVADRFLREGVIVTTASRAFPSESVAAEAHTPDAELPLVLLVDGTSASASEVLAGALQDHARALLVGERTWGKGVVQSVEPFSRSGYQGGIKYTIAHYFTPAGRCIERSVALGGVARRGGLTPDVLVPLDERSRQINETLRDRSRFPHEIQLALGKEDQVEDDYVDRHLEVAVQLLIGSYEPGKKLRKV